MNLPDLQLTNITQRTHKLTSSTITQTHELSVNPSRYTQQNTKSSGTVKRHNCDGCQRNNNVQRRCKNEELFWML